MSDSPDPLGRRALFWAPAERQEEGPRYPDAGDVPGKHALYSDQDAGAHGGRARSRPSRSSRGTQSQAGHPSNRQATRGSRLSAAPARHEGGYAAVYPDDLERPVGSGMFGSLALQCSSCRVRSQVDLVEYIVLHLPIWLWRPGRGYTRFMTCPACRRRTWISASWTSWTR